MKLLECVAWEKHGRGDGNDDTISLFTAQVRWIYQRNSPGVIVEMVGNQVPTAAEGGGYGLPLRVNVLGYTPWIGLHVPQPSRPLLKEHYGNFCTMLNAEVVRILQQQRKNFGDSIIVIDRNPVLVPHEHLFFFRAEETDECFQIRFRVPHALSAICKAMETLTWLPTDSPLRKLLRGHYLLEDTMDFLTRFFAETKLRNAAVYKIPLTSCREFYESPEDNRRAVLRERCNAMWKKPEEIFVATRDAPTPVKWVMPPGPMPTGTAKTMRGEYSSYHYSLFVNYKNLVPHLDASASAPQNIVQTVTRMQQRIICFDLETENDHGDCFSNPKIHPILQISLVFYTFPSLSETDVENAPTWVLSNGAQGAHATCPKNADRVISFGCEEDLLHAFDMIVRLNNPDGLATHNGVSFDWKYVYARADVLGMHRLDFGRYDGTASQQQRRTETETPDKVQWYGKEIEVLNLRGRIQLDTQWDAIRKDRYQTSLQALAQELGRSKYESDMHAMTNKSKTSAGMGSMAAYCAEDSRIVAAWIDHTGVIAEMLINSHLYNVPVQKLLDRGRTYPLQSAIQCVQFSRSPLVLKQETKERRRRIEKKGPLSFVYEGATVIEPEPGYIDGFVAEIDFQRLYPSIIETFNLCPTTLTLPGDVPTDVDIARSFLHIVEGDGEDRHELFFAPKDGRCGRVGILPELMATYHEMRMGYKRMRDDASNRRSLSFYDMLQLLSKKTSNSAYGMLANSKHPMSCEAVAAAITYFGRKYLDLTVKHVQEHFPEYRVLYGDTDSLFFRLPKSIKTLEEAFVESRKVVEHLNSSVYTGRICIELEGLFSSLFFRDRKKAYFGMFWKDEKTVDPEFIIRGSAFKNRSLPSFISDTVHDIAKTAMEMGSYDAVRKCAAIAYVRLLRGEVLLKECIYTERLKKDLGDYMTIHEKRMADGTTKMEQGYSTAVAAILAQQHKKRVARAFKNGVDPPREPGDGTVCETVKLVGGGDGVHTHTQMIVRDYIRKVHYRPLLIDRGNLLDSLETKMRGFELLLKQLPGSPKNVKDIVAYTLYGPTERRDDIFITEKSVMSTSQQRLDTFCLAPAPKPPPPPLHFEERQRIVSEIGTIIREKCFPCLGGDATDTADIADIEDVANIEEMARGCVAGTCQWRGERLLLMEKLKEIRAVLLRPSGAMKQIKLTSTELERLDLLDCLNGIDVYLYPADKKYSRQSHTRIDDAVGSVVLYSQFMRLDPGVHLFRLLSQT